MARDPELPRAKPRATQRRGPHLYQRRGWWWAYLGEGVRESLGTQDATEARNRFAARLADVSRTRSARARTPNERTLTELAAAYVGAPHGWTQRSRHSTALRVAAYVEAMAGFGVEHPSRVTSAVLNGWREQRMATVSRATINRDETVAGAMHGWALREGLARVDPFADRASIREPARTSRRVVPTPAQVLQVATWLAAHKGAGVALVIRVGLATGLRLDELRHLALEDLAPEGVRVVPESGPAETAWTTKGYRERLIPVRAEVIERVREFILWRDAERAHVRGRGAKPRLTAGWFGKGVDRARAALALDGIEVLPFRAHDLRRLFVTLSVRAGIPLDVVQLWVGHRDRDTTQGYLVTLVSDGTLIAPAPDGL